MPLAQTSHRRAGTVRVAQPTCYGSRVATILAHITVKAGRENEFEHIARTLFAASHTNDEGLLRYEYWRGSDPGTYYSLLSFRDFRAFIDHQTSDHHESASPHIGEVVSGIRLEWVDPVDGASALPRTSAQELSGNLDELTKLYARRFAVREAQWWQSLRGNTA